MNTGQMLLVIGALLLLSIVTMSVNSLIVSKTTTMVSSEVNLASISIAQSMLDEIMVCQYDTAAIRNRVYDSTKFTPTARLGREGASGTLFPINEYAAVPTSEPPDTTTAYLSTTKFNDIDDYNGYQRYVYSAAMGTFGVVDTVYYVLETTPDVRSNTQTFFKKIIVTVRHPNMMPPDSMSRYNPWSGRYSVQLSDIAVYRRYF